MSRLIRSAAGAAALVFALAAHAAPPAPFEVKSGVLESVTTGLGQQTTATLYFDDYGRKQATTTTMTMDLGGTKTTSHKLQIQLADGTSYDIDLDEKTGTRMRLPPEAAAALAAAMAPKLTKDAKIEKLPDREFLGKPCKGVRAEAMGIPASIWTWKGLPLFTEASMGPGSALVTRATKLTVDVAVPASRFAVPAGIRIEDMGGQ